MKISTLLWIGAGALALLYFGNLGVAAGVMQYYISGVDFTGITTGRIYLVVQNPSNAAILLQSMAGTVTVNNVQIGNISNFQGGIEIPANQQATVTINVAVSLIGLASSLYTALTSPSGTNQLNFVIAGNANINGGTIVPFNIPQTITV